MPTTDTIAVKVARASEYFLIRDKAALSVGTAWPEVAIVAPERNKFALIERREQDPGEAVVVRGLSLLEAQELAEDRARKAKVTSCSLARIAGTLGGKNLWESVRTYSTKDQAAAPEHGHDHHENPKTKTFHVAIKRVSGTTRQIEGYATLPDVDRDREVVEPSAFKDTLPIYLSNPIMLLEHGHDNAYGYRPIGRIDSIDIRPEGIYVKATVSSTADDIWTLVQEEILKAFSIGFMILEEEWIGGIRHITKAEWLETSLVSIPAGRRALFSVSKALGFGSDLACDGCGGVACDCHDCASDIIPHKRFSLADPREAWTWGKDDEAALVDYGGRELARDCSLTTKQGAQLVHHKLVHGAPATVLEGVYGAMASVLSKSFSLTDTERQRAYTHLSKHLAEYGIAPPEFKMYEPGPCSEIDAPNVEKEASPPSLWVQSILLSRDAFKTEDAAKAWAAEHGYTAEHAETADTVHRMPQFDESMCDPGTARTIDMADGVQAVMCQQSAGKSAPEVVTKAEAPPVPEPAPVKDPVQIWTDDPAPDLFGAIEQTRMSEQPTTQTNPAAALNPPAAPQPLVPPANDDVSITPDFAADLAALEATPDGSKLDGHRLERVAAKAKELGLIV